MDCETDSGIVISNNDIETLVRILHRLNVHISTRHIFVTEKKACLARARGTAANFRSWFINAKQILLDYYVHRIQSHRDVAESQSTPIQKHKVCANAAEAEKQLQSTKPMWDRLIPHFPIKSTCTLSRGIYKLVFICK